MSNIIKTTNMFPITITTKLIECRDFYVNYFGFEAVFEADWYIQLRNESGVELAFMLPNLENQPQILHTQYNGSGVIISFEVEDAEAEYNKLKTAGMNFVFDLKIEEWGQKHFMIIDPSGMIVDIVEQIK